VRADAPDLAQRVAGMQWYHTLELAPGLITPGWFDLRGVPDRIPMPASLAGKRVLDIGTFDGFWAFEMERRGAAEVLAIDVLDPLAWDWPAGSTDEVVKIIGERKSAGAGFELAAEALGSSVRRQELSIYDLTPESVGTFDFVYLGSLLLHLRDPVAGLAAARSVCTGEMLLLDAADPLLSLMHPK
jgi:tRNA (mo5U34)-methyltransferase